MAGMPVDWSVPDCQRGEKSTSGKSEKVLLLGSLLLVLAVLAWAPWLTKEYCSSRVVDHLGGPDRPYVYLGETTTIGEVPKTLQRIPFGALVYFPSEAVYTVTYLGMVI